MTKRWLGFMAAFWLSSLTLCAHATPTDGLLDPCNAQAVTGAENELFKDMPPGSIGYQEAQELYNAGISNGCQTNPLLFCADCEISRAAMVTFVVRAAKLPLQNPAQPTFSDVPTSNPFYQEIETAAAAGITKGCGTGIFCPDAPVTRAAGATFVAKGAGLAPLTPATPSFSDEPASDPFYGYVEAMKAACATNGCGASLFCPANEMTRAQAAVFVAKGFQLGGDPCQTTTDAGTDAAPDDAGADSAAGGGTGSGGTWSDSGIPSDGGNGATAGGGGSPKNDSSSSGSCATAPGRVGSLLGALLAFGAVLGLARRRA